MGQPVRSPRPSLRVAQALRLAAIFSAAERRLLLALPQKKLRALKLVLTALSRAVAFLLALGG